MIFNPWIPRYVAVGPDGADAALPPPSVGTTPCDPPMYWDPAYGVCIYPEKITVTAEGWPWELWAAIFGAGLLLVMAAFSGGKG